MQQLIIQMRKVLCSQCNEIFYDFPANEDIHLDTKCPWCGYYLFRPEKNVPEEQLLEQSVPEEKVENGQAV